MKRKIKFLVYPLAVMLMGLFVIIGCSDDDTDPVNPPTLTTLAVTDITETSAKSGGNITDDGGSAVTARGVIWSTSADLTLGNNEGITSDGAGAGSFTSIITDLEPETQYYVRAYATSSNGTGYGNALAFTTLEETTGTVMDIDGNVYQTVIIGNHEWMAENLRVTKYRNGVAIPTGLSNTEWSHTTSGAYAIYNNDDDILQAYGKLYNWYAVDDERGLCPEGWSVPSDADWTQLVNYVVDQGYPNEDGNPNGAANALKSCRQVNSPLGGDCNTSEHPRWHSHGTHHGFDEFAFSALPGGHRASVGSFGGVGDDGRWWSATESSEASAWRRVMYSYSGNVTRGNYGKRGGFSIRCLRDN